MAEKVEMPRTVFGLVYDGDAVREGEMDVADLAPALLAIGQIAQAAGRLTTGKSAEISVKVRTVEKGSFWIWLDVGVSYWATVRDILTGDDFTAARTILEMLFGIKGLVAYVRALKGRSPEKVERTRPGFVTIYIDGVAMEVPELVFQLANDPATRSALERVVADPLSKDGIEEVEFRPIDLPQTTIEKNERQYFIAPPISLDGAFETNHTKAFSIVSLSFKPGNKWKLSDGHGAAKAVTISDEGFLKQVNESAVRFAKGDVLICEVREIAHQTPKGLKAEYEITRVIEHRPAGDAQQVFKF